jgi:DNA processing protein
VTQPPEASYWLALLHASALRRAVAKQVLWRWGVEQGRPLEELLELPIAEIAQQLALDAQQAVQIAEASRSVPAYAALLDTLAQQGGGVLTRVDVAYPESLAQRLPEERLPYVLFYRGNPTILAESAVAVLGGATPDAAAQDMVRALAEALVAEGYALAGGYDRGCDRLALDAARGAGGQAVLVLPLGLAQFGKALDAMQEALQSGRVLALSPYSPETTYSDALAEARLPVLLALSEAVYLVAPEHDPANTPALAEARAQGKPVFIWAGVGSACTHAWIAAGAVPFVDIAQATALLVDLGDPTPSASAAAEPPAGDGAAPPTSFAGADEAIKALGSSGKVPDVLARRLRETKW